MGRQRVECEFIKINLKTHRQLLKNIEEEK